VTEQELKEILDAVAKGQLATQEAERRLAELITNSRSHLVVATESMGADVKEQKGILVWLKAWAQRLHK
jgi:hypothetical protein